MVHTPQRRRFFSEEVVETITGLLSGKASMKHQENILLLHRQLSTILSIVSSTRKVNLEKFKLLCDEAAFNICDNFPVVTNQSHPTWTSSSWSRVDQSQ